MPRPTVPLAGVHRLVLSLYPRSFRRRYGDAAHELFREWVAAAGSLPAQRRRALRTLLRAVATCLVAWGGTGRDAMRATVAAAVQVGRVAYEGARAGVRQWRHRPLRTAVVVATLAIAVGANTALFAVAHALLLRRLPYEGADRVVLADSGPVLTWVDGEGFAIDDSFRTLPGLDAVMMYAEGGSANLSGVGETARVRIASVSPGFFDVVGVRLRLGRGFLPEDRDRDVVVIGRDLWQGALGGDPSVVGSTLRLNGRAFTVIGVAPAEVTFPSGTELWIPTPFRSEFFGSAFGVHAGGRMREGASAEALTSLLDERYASWIDDWKTKGYEVPPPRLVPLREHLVREIRQPLLTLIGAAALVFLLGGLNLSGVWMNQALERADELRLRHALGASRARILGLLVAETTTTGLLGGGVALLVASAGTAALAARFPADLPGVEAIAVNGQSVALALALVAVAGLGFGGIAALRGARLQESATLGTRGASRGRRLLGGLVVLQGALALTLLVGALLTVRSFQSLTAVPLGLDADRTLAFQLRVPPTVAEGDDALRGVIDAIEGRLAVVPGVQHVGITTETPLSMEMGYAVQLRVPDQTTEHPASAAVSNVSADYFAAAGIPVLEGRTFEATPEHDPGVIIDARLARSLFGDEPAAGRTIEQGDTEDGVTSWHPLRVRAVVGSVHAHGPRNEAYPTIYFDLQGHPRGNLGVLIRSSRNPADLAMAARAAALEVEPDVAPYRVRTLRAAAHELLATDETMAVVGSGFSVAALILAALGLYGLMASYVTHGTREFGVRLALGAVPAGLVRAAVARGLRLGGLALLIGLPAALGATRILRSRLYGVEPTDPLTLALGCAFVLLVSVLAAWIPARRIATIDPREALAAE